MRERTSRDYTYSVGVWLNYPLPSGINRWEAVEDDAEEFFFWRVTDPENPGRVQSSSFYAALSGRDAAAAKVRVMPRQRQHTP
ncbi:hypothetical protein [Streptomyces sp. NPDC005181]|uniref:hypothetical protein n=1 Tax=Streptomyces sp. NPDC005181 TaxID=3156869 RepID=UPI0033B746E1